MDFPTHIAAETAHIRKLAADPGFADYVKDKARRMAKHYPSMYGNLPAVVAEVIKEKADAERG